MKRMNNQTLFMVIHFIHGHSLYSWSFGLNSSVKVDMINVPSINHEAYYDIIMLIMILQALLINIYRVRIIMLKFLNSSHVS